MEIAAAKHFLVRHTDVRAAGLTPRQWALRVSAGEWIAVMPTVWRMWRLPRRGSYEFVQVRAGSEETQR